MSTGDPFLDALDARLAEASAPCRPVGCETMPAKGLSAPQVAVAADFITMEEMARQLAAHHDTTFCDAFSALNALSPNLVPLLKSAEGATLLGFAASLRLARQNPNPLIVVTH